MPCTEQGNLLHFSNQIVVTGRVPDSKFGTRCTWFQVYCMYLIPSVLFVSDSKCIVHTWFQVCDKTYLIPSELDSVPDSKFVRRRTSFQVNWTYLIPSEPGEEASAHVPPLLGVLKADPGPFYKHLFITMTMNDDYPISQEHLFRNMFCTQSEIWKEKCIWAYVLYPAFELT